MKTFYSLVAIVVFACSLCISFPGCTPEDQAKDVDDTFALIAALGGAIFFQIRANGEPESKP